LTGAYLCDQPGIEDFDFALCPVPQRLLTDQARSTDALHQSFDLVETEAIEVVETHLFQPGAHRLLVGQLQIVAAFAIGQHHALLWEAESSMQGLHLECLFTVQAQGVFFSPLLGNALAPLSAVPAPVEAGRAV